LGEVRQSAAVWTSLIFLVAKGEALIGEGAVEVTVVLPTRDRWVAAEVALASALAQTDVAIEVRVVDDGSITSAPHGFDADPRVHLVRHEHPQGVAISRNRAIGEARGEWIAFLDDDDLWAPWHLRLLLAAVRDQGARWGFSGYVMTDLERAPMGLGPVPVVEEDFERQFLRINPIGTPSAMLVATETVRSIRGFDEGMSVLADWDLWVRLSAAWRPAVSTAFSVGYAQHDGNMSLDMDRVMVEWAYMSTRHRSALKRLNVVFADDHYFWRWVARGYDGQGRRRPAARFYLKAATRGGTRRDAVRAIGMLPIVGWPVLIRRRIKAARDRRLALRQTPSSEHTWLRPHEDRARQRVPGSISQTKGTDARSVGTISRRWKLQNRPW
jgi:glycosyltransferase involved in cell wall biosynthesis